MAQRESLETEEAAREEALQVRETSHSFCLQLGLPKGTPCITGVGIRRVDGVAGRDAEAGDAQIHASGTARAPREGASRVRAGVRQGAAGTGENGVVPVGFVRLLVAWALQMTSDLTGVCS